ncbi:MAG TPA: Crp/Fnr family transcriptional regulator [Candidatus Acetothermia bacterium]|nr:Crp/Fnr family transcriptional regulator [Candidatus Acetothermia bacterium]HEX32190.1 Crp/Fnr family transcriptional regulator [Candidatus Acetothermia bacterium]
MGVDMTELKDFRIFADLKEKELQKLQENSRKIKYGRGEIIFPEGAPAFGLYLVFDGMVKLVKRSMRAKSQILKIVGPGELLGETTLFDKGSYNAYAKTLSPAVIGFIERGDIFYFLERHPKTIFRMYSRLSEELKAFQNKLAERSYSSSKERLARLILHLGKSGVELSRAELAEMAGVSSKTAIRTLSELESRGIIAIESRKIKILREEYLQKIMEPFSMDLNPNLII